MAKAAKPNFQHSSDAVQVSPRTHRNDQKGRRKRVARTVDKRLMVTPARWQKVIASISCGATREQAAKSAGVTVQSIDAYLIINVAAFKQLRDAILVWNRRDWSSDAIEHIFDDLAMGMTLKAAAKATYPHLADSKLTSLYRLVRKDKQIREAYDDARELQAESFLDEIIDIADDSENDRLENGRINHEVVNRSKIRIDTRKFAMGAMVKRRFGDTKQIDVGGSIALNHIQMLTGARKRLEKLRPDAVVIENDTGEVAEAQTGE